MTVRKFSILFFLFSVFAGLIGFAFGEWLLYSFYGIWPNTVLIGVYFGVLALVFGLFCLIAELISPVINGRSWRLEYAGLSWKMLVPATLILLFIGGLIFQFLYSINFAKAKTPDDIIMVLDISDSMNKTDPHHESQKAATSLIKNMKKTHRAAIITFNEKAYLTKEMFKIHDKKDVADAINRVNRLKASGNTDIGKALDTAIQHIEENQVEGRQPMVILFSDGYSAIDLAAAIKPYQDKKIIINTIGMSEIDRGGATLLKEIAVDTGGSFYDVKDAKELTKVFERIYLSNQNRLLVTERVGFFQDSLYLAMLRVLLLTAIGMLLGLSLGILFDNRYLAKSFAISGILSGLIAGLTLESGLQHSLLPSFMHRAVADVILTAIIGLGTMIVPIREKYYGARPGGATESSRTFTRKDSVNKGF